MILLVILGYIVIGILEIVPLVKQKQSRELVCYSVLFTIAFTLSILLTLGIKIPSPVQPLQKLVESVIGTQS